MSVILSLIVAGFVVFCGWLVVESGFFECSALNSETCILLQRTTGNEKSGSANAPAEENARLEVADFAIFCATGGIVNSVTLGSGVPIRGFKFQLELSS